jgi:co-chaperonin GroES (HSP10)
MERTKDTNDLSYPEINAQNLSPLQDYILVQWQLAQENLKVGKFILARPDTHRKQVYVGIVIACGPWVDPMIKEGDRVIFDQFSQFEKYWDEELGRVALIKEDKQASLFAIVPPRVEVFASENDFNYDV